MEFERVKEAKERRQTICDVIINNETAKERLNLLDNSAIEYLRFVDELRISTRYLNSDAENMRSTEKLDRQVELGKIRTGKHDILIQSLLGFNQHLFGDVANEVGRERIPIGGIYTGDLDALSYAARNIRDQNGRKAVGEWAERYVMALTLLHSDESVRV